MTFVVLWVLLDFLGYSGGARVRCADVAGAWLSRVVLAFFTGVSVPWAIGVVVLRVSWVRTVFVCCGLQL